jgi:hypothetical protein
MIREWQLVADETLVLAVPGGMLVRTYQYGEDNVTEALCFVPGETEGLVQWADGMAQNHQQTQNDEETD